MNTYVQVPLRQFKVVRSEMGKETVTEMAYTLLQLAINVATSDDEIEMVAVLKVRDGLAIVSGPFSYSIERVR